MAARGWLVLRVHRLCEQTLHVLLQQAECHFTQLMEELRREEEPIL